MNAAAAAAFRQAVSSATVRAGAVTPEDPHLPNQTSSAWPPLRSAIAVAVLLSAACGDGGDPVVEAERLAPACRHDGESQPQLGELDALARALRDPAGAGPRVVTALARGIDQALAELGPHLPTALRGKTSTDGVVQ